jgi:hypothetical protein
MEETPYPKGLKLRMFKNSENFSSRADAINFKFFHIFYSFFIHFLFIFYSFFIHFLFIFITQQILK